MTAIACCLCSKPYQPAAGTHRAFCADCLAKIKVDAHAAECHMNDIRAGRMDTTPDNELQRIIRDDARRQQLPRSQ